MAPVTLARWVTQDLAQSSRRGRRDKEGSTMTTFRERKNSNGEKQKQSKNANVVDKVVEWFALIYHAMMVIKILAMGSDL